MAIEPDQFDYVIVGAGAAGCILANRIATGGGHTVCLLEAGPPDDSLLLRIPAGVYKTSTNERYAWQFETAPNPATANRVIAMPQGRTLGGSTAINGMNYNRGQAADFDGWAEHGNRGWSYADVLPYFKRTERRLGPCDPRYRGTGGALPVTDCDWRHPVCDAFIEAAHNLGLPRNPDYNGATQSGAGYYQRYIEKGWRVSAARAFLHPIARHPNLVLRTGAQVTAVLLRNKRASGVRYAYGASRGMREVRARREVILCAGAANTPKLLQLSGIGPAAVAAAIGVPLVHELPGVGGNLQDHYMVHLVARVKNASAVSGHGFALLREAARWAIGRPSLFAISPSLVYAFANSRDLRSVPDIQLDLALGNYSTGLAQRMPVLKLGFYQLRPWSRGFVRAASADPFRHPIIQPGYLSDARDRQVAVDGIRMLRTLLDAPELRPYYDGEELPGPTVTTTEECLQFAREAGLTAYHLSGTCRMGQAENPAAVVDDQFRVHGLDALRVADASITPRVPSANTSAAVFMIAEKAADMILGRPPLPAAEIVPAAMRRSADRVVETAEPVA